MIEALALLLGALCCVAAGAALQWTLSRRRTRDERDLGTPVERATFHTLHTAALAAPPLRAGLTEDTARKAVRRLRSLLGTPALCLTDLDTALTWDGAGDHHRAEAMVLVADVLADGRPRVVGVACTVPGCDLRWAAVAPLEVDGRVLGALAAFGPDESPALLRATGEVARWVAVQLELAELDRSRSRLIEAEIRTLRAQISPHFIFNSLAAIASFVRTDPDRARELLLEFADFTRYSFRRHGDFTSLADELRSIDQYLALVRARFGDRLRVTLRVAPEVLPVALPFLCLQPLVENAVKHGIEGHPDASRIVITADDGGSEAVVVIEDDGVGVEPERLREILAGRGGPSHGIGLSNVDERMRQVYGDDHGLMIETGVGAGMKITVRIPKYHPGVQVTAPPGPAA
ncbi:sensor histidine kinase [Kitasatospora sp. GAS204B]|uniref:sensor histidine kinase n=1 Tax=unclassified Kitasatospora TaxID=2633591 RepID=UPI002475C2EE|nr:histidine kinase [Kitasatospora sp. GAS204B]MDH6116795.1 two-component system LytT family sensor kinase [Kitasatospora sp. GAS204B]